MMAQSRSTGAERIQSCVSVQPVSAIWWTYALTIPDRRFETTNTLLRDLLLNEIHQPSQMDYERELFGILVPHLDLPTKAHDNQVVLHFE